MALTVDVNGTSKTFEKLAAGNTLEDVVRALDLKADRIAIEHNGTIVSRDGRGSAVVADGDKIEIVHFVGGGTGKASNSWHQRAASE